MLLAGTAVFLPYRSCHLSCFMMIMIILRDKVRHDVSGNIRLVRHGTAHQGPVGQEVSIRLFTCDIVSSLK